MMFIFSKEFCLCYFRGKFWKKKKKSTLEWQMIMNYTERCIQANKKGFQTLIDQTSHHNLGFMLTYRLGGNKVFAGTKILIELLVSFFHGTGASLTADSSSWLYYYGIDCCINMHKCRQPESQATWLNLPTQLTWSPICSLPSCNISLIPWSILFKWKRLKWWNCVSGFSSFLLDNPQITVAAHVTVLYADLISVLFLKKMGSEIQ